MHGVGSVKLVQETLEQQLKTLVEINVLKVCGWNFTITPMSVILELWGLDLWILWTIILLLTPHVLSVTFAYFAKVFSLGNISKTHWKKPVEKLIF